MYGLILLDFVFRSLIGTPFTSKITDPEGFRSKLIAFADSFAGLAYYLGTKQWKNALLQFGKIATASTTKDLIVALLVEAGVKVAPEKLFEILGSAPAMVIKAIANIPIWWDFWNNIKRDPTMEDVILTVRRVEEPVPADLKITESLTIEQGKPYYPGEKVRVRFSVRNVGGTPVTVGVLTVRAEGPIGETLATLKTGIRLNPGEVYNYRGDLVVYSAGEYHLSVEYKTLDGRWVRDVLTEAGALNALDIYVNPLPDDLIVAVLGSPAELRVYDSQGRVTGLVNGEERSEIPHSLCHENTVVVLLPRDAYRVQVVGTGSGAYNLTVVKILGNESTAFNASGIPITPKAVHQYTVDWSKLSRGEKGVTVEVDSDGDGKFDWSFAGGKRLTKEEFTPPFEAALRSWIPFIGVAAVALALVVAIAILRTRRRRLPPPPPPPPPGAGLR